MFIKVTRSTGRSENFKMILPIANIVLVCDGYEKGSRIQLGGNRDEIEVHESVDQIWQMMKEMK